MMHRLGSFFLGATLLVVGSSSIWAQPTPGGAPNRPTPMVISSTGFEDGGVLQVNLAGYQQIQHPLLFHGSIRLQVP